MKDAKDIIVRLRADYAEVFSSPRMCNMIGAILYFMDDGADEFIRFFSRRKIGRILRSTTIGRSWE